MSDEMKDPEPVPTVKPKHKGGRPRKVVTAAAQAVVAQAGIAPTAEQWNQLIAALASNKAADMEIAATVNAQAMKKALRPENEISPMISVYNPKGETKYPRPKPTHIYMMARYPICDPGNYDTTTWTELELLNQLKPGEYPVTKGDGLDVKVLVKTEFDSAGRPYKTTLFADGRGIRDDEEKNNWPPLLQILTQIVTGEAPSQSFARYQRIIDDLRAQQQEAAAKITTLEAQLAASAA